MPFWQRLLEESQNAEEQVVITHMNVHDWITQGPELDTMLSTPYSMDCLRHLLQFQFDLFSFYLEMWIDNV